jgi:pimeloyl-ACP methyl ester carboxylesterase
MPTPHHITVNDLTIHYLEAGTPDHLTPPILLLHGFPTSSHLYRNVIPTLAETHRVIALDLSGYGLSDKPLDVDYPAPPSSATSSRAPKGIIGVSFPIQA